MPNTRITSRNGRPWAVVPVKLLSETKRRLKPLLSPDEREMLACAMLADVLSALTRAHGLAGVMVITGDDKAAAIAREMHALVIRDRQNSGTAAAVTQAAHHLLGEGHEGMLVVPADVPLITPADIEAIMQAHHRAPSVTLVPASADGGTNALACSPPDVIPFRFGEDSFRRHLEAARSGSIEPQVVELQRVEQDIDRPEDVAAFLLHASPTRSYACLTRSGIVQRLNRVMPIAASPCRAERPSA